MKLLLLALLLAAAPLPQGRLVCEVPVRKIPLSELGLPEGSRPRDLALTKSTVWILFEPALLVGFDRQAKELDEVEMVYGARGDAWETLSASPRDGSLWMASSTVPRLWHKPPLGRVRPVRVPQAKEGGFRDLAVRWDALYLAPTSCSDGSVWRVDPSGKLLGTALPHPGCPPVDLETDWSGQTWARFPETGETFTLDGSRWNPNGSPVPWPERAGPFRGWFFWGTEPVSIGGGGGEEETVLVRGAEPFREDCGAGNRLLRVAGDSRGWAALTREWLLLGEHAVESPQ